MRIYLDTEFTSLEKPKLISLGLVSQDEQEFYRELIDTWRIQDCTMFVVGWVLPWLSDGRVGNDLYSRLGFHLDLIQRECDADGLFPGIKEKLLIQGLKDDPDLLEYLMFISSERGITDMQVHQNKCLLKQLGPVSTCQPGKILYGNQAQLASQVVKDLSDWLSTFDHPVICCDSDYDKDLLMQLFVNQGQQPNFNFELIRSSGEVIPGLQLHHALDDARMLRAENVSL